MKVTIEKERHSKVPKWVLGIQVNERKNYLSAMTKNQLKEISDTIVDFLKDNN